MTRAITDIGTRPFRCKLCDNVGSGWKGKDERAVAQHVAMTYGVSDKKNVHKIWKEKHGFAVVPRTMHEANQSTDMILAKHIHEVAEGTNTN